MRSSWFTRAAQGVLALSLLTAAIGVQPATAKPFVDRPARPRAINLFAAAGLLFQVNNNVCGLANVGQVCVAFAGSPVGGGGFWPKGTPDQYIFQSGIQLAGVIDAGAGFTWAGDTVGAYLVDTRGTQEQGDGLELIYDALNPTDAANWPNGAVIRDTAIYNSVLIGRNTISQGDNWTRYWEGDPAFLSGRAHPMGIAMDQRGLAWNFPSGNEDIMYFIFTFYNVTARASSGAYNNPTIDPAMQAEIGAIGDRFQNLNEQKFGIAIPDGGYTITSMYSAFTEDADVAVFSDNYSTAVLPFNLGTSYSGRFLPEVGWQFPPALFGAPFAEAPGFTAVKYLRSPESSPGNQVGLTMFSTFVNQATGFPDPVGVNQLYRYLSGFLGSTDNPCNSSTNPQIARDLRLCFLAQFQADSRFFMSSGPFVLPPGESRTIVVAYIHGAPLAAPLAALAAGGGGIGGNNPPGVGATGPATGDSIFANPARVRGIERVMGWVSQGDSNGNQIIEQNEVVTAPRSLLNKALVAQAVFDNKFLLPFAPEAPQFFLVPGDNQVTVVWQKSLSEATGDPFYVVASDATSPLYDPNFREFDVEGYRVFRGRTAGSLELIGQFDYDGTTIVDFTGAFDYGAGCAPELGIQSGCPVTFQTAPPYTASESHDLSGNVIQIPPGGRVELASGAVFVLRADTAVVGGGSTFPELANAGVPFAFTDRGVRNSFTYHYAVTAFDVNSIKSGPTSLESPRVTKAVVPRRPSTNASQTVLIQGMFGENGAALNPSAPFPTIDPANGTFTGIIPPANDGQLLMSSAVLEALPGGDITVRIDSFGPGFTGGIGVEPNLYVSLIAAGDTVRKVLPITQPTFNSSANPTYTFSEALVPYDSAAARRFKIAFTQDVRMPVSFQAATVPVRRTSVGIATTVGRFGVGSAASRYLAHSRWFDASGSEPPDPTIVAGPDSSKNSGRLTNVGRIWAPAAYRDAGVNLNMRGYAYAMTAWYPADFLVTWNADSSLTVRDSTHRITLPFAPNGGTGWGFVNLRSLITAGVTAGAGVVSTDVDDGTGTPSMTALTYHHIYGTQPTCFPDWWAIPCAPLERTPEFQPLDFNSDGAQDGTASGIGLMINGEVFIMEMNAIPAAGTQWRLRAITGDFSATCTPAIGTAMTDCSAYAVTGQSVRPSRAPGLSYTITVQQQYAVDSTVAGDISNVHTVPDPYYVTNALEFTQNSKVLKFVNLPSRAVIRIYSVSGVLVNVLTHNDPTGGGETTWNLRNRNNQFVASGVYFYHVEAPGGSSKVGRFTVVTFAP